MLIFCIKRSQISREKSSNIERQLFIFKISMNNSNTENDGRGFKNFLFSRLLFSFIPFLFQFETLGVEGEGYMVPCKPLISKGCLEPSGLKEKKKNAVNRVHRL